MPPDDAFLPEGPVPTTLKDALAELQFDGLPNRSVWDAEVQNMLKDNFAKLAGIFCHYCKQGSQGSDYASIETTSRLRLGQPSSLCL